MRVALVVLMTIFVPRALYADALLSVDHIDHVVMHADEETMVGNHAEFHGHVLLQSPTQTLAADHLTIDFKQENGRRKIDHAIADGDVLLIDGSTVAACQHMELNGDLIRAALQVAEIHVKRPRTVGVLPPDYSALSAGRDSLYVSGNIERIGPKKFHITDVYFTPCDCGTNKRPTFSIRAKEGTIEIGGDAFFYRPVLQPLDFALPFPFALPAMFFPVSKRKSGFLIPQPSSTTINPTVAHPQSESAFDIEEDYFWAINNQFDATAAAGINTVRGPRGEFEFRDAPSLQTNGAFDATYNFDQRYMADHLNDFPNRGGDLWGPNRLALGAVERVDTNGRFPLRINGNFFSDSYYLLDNTFTLQSQALPYSVSRAAFDIRGDEVRLQTGAALYQDFSTTRGTPGDLWGPNEAKVPQRIPEAALSVAPQALPGGIWLGADTRAVLQKRFTELGVVSVDNVPYGNTEARGEFLPRLSRPTQIGGVSIQPEIFGVYAEHVGDLREQDRPLGLVGGRIEMSMQLARYFHVGDTVWRHRIKPIVRYQIVPKVWNNAASDEAFDERDQVVAVNQLSVGFESDISRKVGKAASERLLSVSVMQHFNLGNIAGLPIALVPPVGEIIGNVTLQVSRWASLYYTTAADYQKEIFPFHAAGVKLVDIRADPSRQPVSSFRIDYQNMRQGGAATTNTGLFELSPGGAITTGLAGELHTISLDGQLSLYWGLYASYGFDATLALRGTGTKAWVPSAVEIASNERSFATQHRFTFGYVSPCQCFGVSVVGTLLRNQYLGGFSSPAIQALFTVGDYTVGTNR